MVELAIVLRQVSDKFWKIWEMFYSSYVQEAEDPLPTCWRLQASLQLSQSSSKKKRCKQADVEYRTRSNYPVKNSNY